MPSERLQDLRQATRIAASVPHLPLALRALCTAAGCYVLADIAYLSLVLTGSYGTGAVVDTLWHLTPALMGVAALHTSRTQVTSASQPATSPIRSRHPTHTAVALLLNPGILVLQAARGVEISLAVNGSNPVTRPR